MAVYDVGNKYVNKAGAWQDSSIFLQQYQTQTWSMAEYKLGTKYVNKAVDRAGGWSLPGHFHQSADRQLSPLPLYCISIVFLFLLYSIVIAVVSCCSCFVCIGICIRIRFQLYLYWLPASAPFPCCPRGQERGGGLASYAPQGLRLLCYANAMLCHAMLC